MGLDAEKWGTIGFLTLVGFCVALVVGMMVMVLLSFLTHNESIQRVGSGIATLIVIAIFFRIISNALADLRIKKEAKEDLYPRNQEA